MRKMPWDEFCNLLATLGKDTPLVQTALIRKETDPDVIKNFTEEQKEENRRWREKIREKYAQNINEQDVEAKYALLRSLFGNGGVSVE